MALNFTTDATLIKAGAIDDYGDPVAGSSEQSTIKNVVVNPFRDSTEDNDRRNQSWTYLTLYDQTYANVSPRDIIVLLNTRYEVVGTPQRAQSPFTGWAPGQVIELKRVAG